MSLYSLETAGHLSPFLSLEWLLTNGLGGFASSTVVGCNTRRYHGLLVGATLPPVGRVMAVNRVGELLYFDGRRDNPSELSISQFAHRFHPRGDKHLQKFELGDIARWEFLAEGVRVIKELCLLRGRNVAGLRYTIERKEPRAVELHLLPFVAMRDFHHLRHGKSDRFRVTAEGERTVVTEGQHKLYLRSAEARFENRPDWWTGHHYAIDSERGQDHVEDLFVPGAFVVESVDRPVVLWMGLEDELEDVQWPGSGGGNGVTEYRSNGVRAGSAESTPLPRHPVTPLPSATQRRLYHAANDFVVKRRRPDGTTGATVIAGYPWFSDWGRDTMISLPGLLLTTGRFQEAAGVLSVFAQYVSEGMIPNVFDDYSNQPHYNTVDASLWFIHACFEYVRLSADARTFEDHLLPACRAIINGYREGTRFKIRMDPADGLLWAGDATTQLTWMDAKCDGVVFTPRHGKAVEINALWYNALRLMNENELAGRVAESFQKAFWFNAFRGLYDVITPNSSNSPDPAGDRKDKAIRPNQIFAVSLPHSPLMLEQQRAVVEVVRRELLTPYGLRSLARTDPHYIGHYRGPAMERDRAYHNGTVWGWLIGPFLDAYLRTENNSPAAIEQARTWLSPMIAHLEKGCIGQLPEIFDGDAPHNPRGTFAQAWTVAEVLRLAARLGM